MQIAVAGVDCVSDGSDELAGRGSHSHLSQVHHTQLAQHGHLHQLFRFSEKKLGFHGDLSLTL